MKSIAVVVSLMISSAPGFAQELNLKQYQTEDNCGIPRSGSGSVTDFVTPLNQVIKSPYEEQRNILEIQPGPELEEMIRASHATADSLDKIEKWMAEQEKANDVFVDLFKALIQCAKKQEAEMINLKSQIEHHTRHSVAKNDGVYRTRSHRNYSGKSAHLGRSAASKPRA